MDRHNSYGHVLSDSVRRNDWTPKKRVHRVNLRLDEDLYRRIRREAEEANMTLSAVLRLALVAGIETVTAERMVASATREEGATP